MNLKYIGINERGRATWAELDLADKFRPQGRILEEWQVNQYRPFVEGIEKCIGRKLERDELSTVEWLSGYEQSTVDNIMNIIKTAYENGKKLK